MVSTKSMRRCGMRRQWLLGALIVGVVTGLLSVSLQSSVALAAGNKHVAEAIEHAKEAIEHGKKGHADVLVKHAEVALKHAEAAQKDMKDNPHVAEGVKGLKDA